MTGMALLDDAEVLDTIRAGATRARSGHAAMLEGLAEARTRGLDTEAGYRSMAEFVKHLVRANAGEAKRWVAQADALFPTVTPSGAVLEAVLPAASAAAAAGVLWPAHLDVLVEAMATLPAEAEQILVEVATAAEPAAVRAVANGIRARIDQDGPEPAEHVPAERANLLHLRTKTDGRVEFSGRLGPEQGELLRALISPLAKPHVADATGPDIRTLPERQGDAFVDVLDLASRSRDLPTEAGERPHVTVTVGYETLRSGIGTATMGDDTVISAADARRIACTAGIIPAVLGRRGEVLDIGRISRKPTARLRHALRVRDGGCSFPHCDRPPNWTDAHHVREWQHGGETNLENLVLLCRKHHTLIHHSEWEIRMSDGIPHFHPPAFIDPQRKPLRNLTRRLVS